MKKLLLILFILFGMMGCKSKYSLTEDGLQTKVMVSDTITVIGENFNEYCSNHQIPFDLELWQVNYIKDYESKTAITQYIYMIDNEAYSLSKTDSMYFVTHRYFK